MREREREGETERKREGGREGERETASRGPGPGALRSYMQQQTTEKNTRIWLCSKIQSQFCAGERTPGRSASFWLLMLGAGPSTAHAPRRPHTQTGPPSAQHNPVKFSRALCARMCAIAIALACPRSPPHASGSPLRTCPPFLPSSPRTQLFTSSSSTKPRPAEPASCIRLMYR